METKIIFNGKQYASPEAMPEDVRQAYQQAMANLRTPTKTASRTSWSAAPLAT